MEDSKPIPRTSLEPVCPALAERTRLSRQMLSIVESGRRVPTIDTVARISRGLGVPAIWLVVEAEAVEKETGCGGEEIVRLPKKSEPGAVCSAPVFC